MNKVIDDAVVISGGRVLNGSVQIPGDKNVTAPLLFAAVINEEKTILNNASLCEDVYSILRWIKLTERNLDIDYQAEKISISKEDGRKLNDLREINHIRSSICLVSAKALKYGSVVFSEDIGGCNFTSRKIDRHIELIKAFGIRIEQEETSCVAIKTRDVGNIIFDCATSSGIPSVGVTCHALIASIVFQGGIRLVNVAQEPSVELLVEYVREATGKKVVFSGRSIVIEAVQIANIFSSCNLQIPCDVTIVLTFVAVAMVTRSNITLLGAQLNKALRDLLFKSGIKMIATEEGIQLEVDEVVHPRLIECRVWPEIPTDIGPVFSAGLVNVAGNTKIIDHVYDKRSSHLEGMRLMGYNLLARANEVEVIGAKPVNSFVQVVAPDIRAGAALIIAALGRQGITVVSNYKEIKRGYHNLVYDLKKLGASIDYV